MNLSENLELTVLEGSEEDHRTAVPQTLAILALYPDGVLGVLLKVL